MKEINISIQWHITSYCPNKCKHCYMYTEDIDKIKSEEPSIVELIKIYNNIHHFEIKYNVEIKNYILTGGDPLISSCFKELALFLKKQSKNLYILSIPEAVTNENVLFLKKINIAFFQMSIDGCETTHDMIRGIGSFAKTLDAIKKLSNSNIPIGIMYTVHKYNMKDMFEVIDILDRLNVALSFGFDLMVEEGNAVNSNICQMLDEEMSEPFFNKYIEKVEEFRNKESKVKLTFKNKLLILKKVLENDCDFSGYEKFSECGGCYAGYSAVGILPNGDFMPCRRLSLVTGNLHQETFEYLFLGDKTIRKMRRPQFFEYCSDCKFFKMCKGCMALAMAFHKDPFAKVPYCVYKVKLKEDEKKENYAYPDIECTYEQEWRLICDTVYNRMLIPKSIEDIRLICKNSL